MPHKCYQRDVILEYPYCECRKNGHSPHFQPFPAVVVISKPKYQRLIVTYSPKFARYQKTIRDRQVAHAKKMLEEGNVKKERRNPNDPTRFIGKKAVTDDGEAATIHNYLDEDKIDGEV